MSFMDFIFGEDPSVETGSLTTWTPGQQVLFSDILGPYLNRDPALARGDLPGISQQEGISLIGLENMANMAGTGNLSQDYEGAGLALNNLLRTQGSFGSQFGALADARRGDPSLQSLMGILGRGPADFEDFFRTNIREPALEEFETKILPNIGRALGGGNFFGTERAQADTDAREDLLDALTQSRSKLAFASQQQDVENIFGASELIGQQTGRAIDTASAIDKTQLTAADIVNARESNAIQRGTLDLATLRDNLLAGGLTRQVTGQHLSREDLRIQQLLTALGLTGQENFAEVNPGTSGIFGDLLGFVGGEFDFSDLLGFGSPSSPTP